MIVYLALLARELWEATPAARHLRYMQSRCGF